ncbi:MAG: hypothetical protein UX26_C0037G0014, partial [Parcubacteria group bacterium GW2011_GWC1_45_9]
MSYLRLAHAFELKNKKERRVYRLLEIFPGFLTWLTFILMFFGAVFFPMATSFFLISFTIFWFLRTVYLMVHLRSGFLQMRKNQKTDWRAKLSSLKLPNPALPQIKSWQEIIHLVIIPSYGEPYEVIKEVVGGISNSGYPTEKIAVVLAMEQRDGELQKQREVIAEKIKSEYQDRFLQFLVSFHPGNIPGEIAGKGSNEHYAGKKALAEIIDAKNIPYENVIVSCFDADTVVSAGYFDRLAFAYLTCEKPLRSSFQPVPLFLNNIWESPSISKIFAFSTSFWQLIQQSRPEILVTFSSQSIGLKPLVEVGFWQENVVSEDSRIFYQCLLHFDGDWQTVPLYFPVNMDANVAQNFWQTSKNIYKQQKRWAYGAENIPYLLFGFMKNKNIPKRIKWRFGFNIIEGFHSWNTHSVIILCLGWILLWLGGKEFGFSILSFNLPQILGSLMRLSMYGIFISMYMTIALLPPPPKEKISKIN